MAPEGTLIRDEQGHEQGVIPVVHRVERAAEKCRTFVERPDVRADDAFDLWYYRTHVLRSQDERELKRLVALKLKDSKDLGAESPSDRFKGRLAACELVWPGTMTVAGETPSWEQVRAALMTFEPLFPAT
jgi:hypothetical protein